MLLRKRLVGSKGFTLTELLIMIVITGILGVTGYSFFNTSLSQYFSLQKEGTALANLATQSQRIATVLRGATEVTAASADEITCYAYFAPQDAYVSLIRYYKANGNTELLADVTPMSANPPTGTPLTAQKKTYTIIDIFYQVSGVDTFSYLDSLGDPLTLPISDLTTIKGLQVELAVPGSVINKDSNQAVTVQVSLRNEKTNL